MINLDEPFIFVTHESGLCEPLNHAAMMLECALFRWSALANNLPPIGTGGDLLMEGRAINKNVMWPIVGPFALHVRGEPLAGFRIVLSDEGPADRSDDISSNALSTLIQIPVRFAFTEYYEAKKPQNHSASWDFARVVRNAFSHGGRVHFTNPNAPQLEWRGVVLSYADNGAELFHATLSMADILVLLLDLASEIGDLPDIPDGALSELLRSQF